MIDWLLVYVLATVNYGAVLFAFLVAGTAAPRAPVDSDTSSRFYWFNTERPNTTHVGDDLLCALLGVFSTPAIAGGYLFAFYADTDAFAHASVNYFYACYLLRIVFILTWAIGFYRWTLHTVSVLLSSVLLLLVDGGLLATMTYVAAVSDMHQISYAVAALLVALTCVFCDFFFVVCNSIVHLAWRSAVFSTINQQAIGRGGGGMDTDYDEAAAAAAVDGEIDDEYYDEDAFVAYEAQQRQRQIQQQMQQRVPSTNANGRSPMFNRLLQQQQQQ